MTNTNLYQRIGSFTPHTELLSYNGNKKRKGNQCDQTNNNIERKKQRQSHLDIETCSVSDTWARIAPSIQRLSINDRGTDTVVDLLSLLHVNWKSLNSFHYTCTLMETHDDNYEPFDELNKHVLPYFSHCSKHFHSFRLQINNVHIMKKSTTIHEQFRRLIHSIPSCISFLSINDDDYDDANDYSISNNSTFVHKNNNLHEIEINSSVFVDLNVFPNVQKVSVRQLNQHCINTWSLHQIRVLRFEKICNRLKFSYMMHQNFNVQTVPSHHKLSTLSTLIAPAHIIQSLCPYFEPETMKTLILSPANVVTSKNISALAGITPNVSSLTVVADWLFNQSILHFVEMIQNAISSWKHLKQVNILCCNKSKIGPILQTIEDFSTRFETVLFNHIQFVQNCNHINYKLRFEPKGFIMVVCFGPPSQISLQQISHLLKHTTTMSDEQLILMRFDWKGELTVGDIYTVINIEFWNEWCHYTNSDPHTLDDNFSISSTTTAQKPIIGVSTIHLVQPDEPLKLKPDLQLDKDFICIHENAANLLYTWYKPIGDRLDRKVIYNIETQQCEIDLFPILIEFSYLQDHNNEITYFKKMYTKHTTFYQIEYELYKELNVNINYQMKFKFNNEKWIEDDDKYVPLHEMHNNNTNNKYTVWIQFFQNDFSSLEFLNSIKVGDQIDALDQFNKWYESIVCDLDYESQHVYVHFYGWEKKWDRWIPLNSEQVAPYQTKSFKTSIININQQQTICEVGAVGFENLGNTCFMNSILACLMHTPILQTYFLNDTYLDDLNFDNPLGWRGRIANQFASLLKQFWSNDFNTLSPKVLKKIIGNFQPRFNGYEQQDASELLAFLLDGLHEDLNRSIKTNLPNTLSIDQNQSNDEAEMSQMSWNNYKTKNQSIIVDLLQGQTRSFVQCPEDTCKKRSITFEPITILSVPLTQSQDLVINTNLISSSIAPQQQQIPITLKETSNILDFKRLLSKSTSIPIGRLTIAFCINKYIKHFYFLTDTDEVSKMKNKIVYAFECIMLDGNDYDDQINYIQIPIILVRKTQIYIQSFNVLQILMIPDLYKDQITIKRLCSFAEIEETIIIIIMDRSTRKCVVCDQSCFDTQNHIQCKNEYERTLSSFNAWSNIAIGLNFNYDMEKECMSNKNSVEYCEKPLLLQTCLNKFSQEEVLSASDSWYCSNCKKHQQAIKKIELYKLPEILVIQLKRFEYTNVNRQKLSIHVDFPLNDLDLSDLTTSTVEKSRNCKYDCFAICNHLGTLQSGHYNSFVKNLSSGEWYLHDDSKVSPVTNIEKELVTNFAYLLFYKRQS